VFAFGSHETKPASILNSKNSPGRDLRWRQTHRRRRFLYGRWLYKKIKHQQICFLMSKLPCTASTNMSFLSVWPTMASQDHKILHPCSHITCTQHNTVCMI